jgi:hypothetical protein
VIDDLNKLATPSILKVKSEQDYQVRYFFLMNRDVPTYSGQNSATFQFKRDEKPSIQGLIMWARKQLL